jgi:hypothetical protein
MKNSLALAGLLIVGAAITPAFAHTCQESDKAWIDRMFKVADTDGNGTISKDEFMAYSEEKFDKMDTTGDGELTRKEVMAYHKHEMKLHQKKCVGTPVTERQPVPDQKRIPTSKDAKANSKNGSDTGQ